MQTSTSYYRDRAYRFVTHPLALLVLGALIGAGTSWAVSAHFYQKSKEEAIQEAIQEERQNAFEETLKDAEKALRKRIPEMIREQYPEEIENARARGHAEGKEAGTEEGYNSGKEDGFREGRDEGRKEGETLGYDRGLRDGRTAGDKDGYERGLIEGYESGVRDGISQANAAADMVAQAERNWEVYEKLIYSTASSADRLEKERGNPELESELRSRVRAVVENAEELQIEYENQKNSFNTIMIELREAYEANNLPRMRELIRAIRDALGTKRELFIGANKNAMEAFNDMEAAIPR